MEQIGIIIVVVVVVMVVEDESCPFCIVAVAVE